MASSGYRFVSPKISAIGSKCAPFCFTLSEEIGPARDGVDTLKFQTETLPQIARMLLCQMKKKIPTRAPTKLRKSTRLVRRSTNERSSPTKSRGARGKRPFKFLAGNIAHYDKKASPLRLGGIMPTGPKNQKRPANVIGKAIMVAKIRDW